MTEFDDLTKRIIDKLDILDEKIDKLCLWKERMEVEWENHQEDIESKQQNKDKRFYVIIAAMGISFTIIEVVQGFL